MPYIREDFYRDKNKDERDREWERNRPTIQPYAPDPREGFITPKAPEPPKPERGVATFDMGTNTPPPIDSAVKPETIDLKDLPPLEPDPDEPKSEPDDLKKD